MARWLLVHPPLLGPAVLGPLADRLRGRGHDVAVPDLRPAVATAQGWPARWSAGAGATGPADVVLGYSGAGATLPSVAVAVGAGRVIWVDAGLPARAGATEADEEIRTVVAPLVADGRIADWTTWWGPGALETLVPDPDLRAAVLADGHTLPADFFEVAVPVPAEWPETGARYVQLSPAYDDAAAEARARGWTVVGDAAGGHLDIATSPARVEELLRWPGPADLGRHDGCR